MKMKLFLVFFITGTVFISCSHGPVPIDYGMDECHHCSMVIMDNRYGTEVLLNTGKALKFDAIECMVSYLKVSNEQSEHVAQVMITDFNHPGQLVDAAQGHFLHSKNLPSPMGLFLTGFRDEQSALAARSTHEGHVYSWEELLKFFEILQIDYQL